MADYDYLPVSNGSGDAALMHVQTDRLTGSTTLDVDTVANVPAKGIASSGTLLSTGFIDPATKKDFKFHVSGSDLVIDAFESGSTDTGNTEGQVVVVKPNSGWSNRVATFIKNATGFDTPEAVTFATLAATAISAVSAAFSAAVTIATNLSVTGNVDITGTSRLVGASVTTADGSNNITPTKQIFNVTALAHDATVLVPTFSPFEGMTGELKILAATSDRALTWPSGWVAIGVTLPTVAPVGKYLYIGYRYNAVDTKWHVRSVVRQA